MVEFARRETATSTLHSLPFYLNKKDLFFKFVFFFFFFFFLGGGGGGAGGGGGGAVSPVEEFGTGRCTDTG